MTPDVQNFLPKKPMFRFDCKCGQKPRKCFIQVTNRIEFVLKKINSVFSLWVFFFISFCPFNFFHDEIYNFYEAKTKQA